MNRRIRIIFIIDKLAPGIGGTATHLTELLKGIDRNIYNPLVCALGGEKEGAHIDKIRGLGVEIVFWGINKIYGFKALLFLPKAVNFIKKGKFDLVCTYLFSSNIYGVLVARLAGAKSIIANKREIVTWKKWHHILASKIANAYCSRIVVNSNISKEAIEKIEGVPVSKIVVIHNGVDLAKFDPAADRTEQRKKLGIGTSAVVIGMMSNFIPIKDHDTFFKAAHIVLAKHPEVRVLLLGGGYLETEMRKKALELRIENSVIFAGRRTDVPAYLAAMDIYVCTSLFEGFSNALLEAQAMAKPVIVTAVGGNLDLVIDGQNGFLFPKKDPAALASKINQLIDNKPLAREMGARGRKIIEEKFTSQEMARKTEELYMRLLNSKSKIKD